MAFKTIFRSKWVWIASALLVLVIIAAGVTQKPSVQTVSLEQRNSEWQAAEFKYRRVTPTQLTQLNAAALWGIESAEKVADQTAPWALKGIIEDLGIRVALIDLDIEAETVNRDRFVRVREGDRLPNGAKLIKIGKGYVEYEQQGVIATKRLYE